SIKTITYLSDIGCLEIQGASLLKTMPTYTLLRSVWGLPTVACRRLKAKPRSTSTPKFFLRKTNSITFI
ncbi:hypothetical protein, partial [Escherichia coli]|uniref:hypothetical protein n=1 Tax=Escherichia coli TaxID=562 RepID=UPI00321A1066